MKDSGGQLKTVLYQTANLQGCGYMDFGIMCLALCILEPQAKGCHNTYNAKEILISVKNVVKKMSRVKSISLQKFVNTCLSIISS